MQTGLSRSRELRAGSTERPNADELTLREFIYVVYGDRASAQIGWTITPSSRISHLQTLSESRIHFAYVASVSGSAEAVKQGAHDILKDHRFREDWFGVSPELATAAVAVAAHRLRVVLEYYDPQTAERTIPPIPMDSRDAKRRYPTWVLVVATVLGAGLGAGLTLTWSLINPGGG